MGWKESDKMSERVKFVARYLDGERITDLCKEFGVSRKTGHKLVNRYKNEGVEGLYEKPKLPYYRPNQTPFQVEQLILNLRKKHKTWGALKIKHYLERKHKEVTIPAASTIHEILVRHSMVKKRKRRCQSHKAKGTDLSVPTQANDLWCTDFKGHFRLGNSNYCYPLTVTDQFSRNLLCCEALEGTKEAPSIKVFERVFTEYGIPKKIRSDNGVPFATNSLYGLSTLSVWWLRLGIELERIEPGHPEQNGQHERMHRTLKATVIKPPAQNMIQQQEKFDEFVDVYNNERPHQGINMQCPSDLYSKSASPYPGYLKDIEYPSADRVVRVTNCGQIYIGNNKKVHISEVFRYQTLGLKEVEEDLFEVSFMDKCIGYFDKSTYRLAKVENPFLTKDVLKI